MARAPSWARGWIGVSTVIALGALAPEALAQDVAAAEALFDRGLAAMEKADFETGCPAIEESYRLDPRPGTLFTLAECENKRGRTATAATRYEDYLAFHARLPADQQQKQGERPRIAAEQRDALRARAPRLTLVVPQAAPEGTKVSRDGVDLAKPSWGVALPGDPGERVVRVEAPGRAPAEQRVTIADGQRLEVAVSLGAETSEPPAGAPPPSAPPAPAEEGLTGVQTAGLVVGGLGVVGLGLGAVFGIVTLGHASDAEDACGGLPGDNEGCTGGDMKPEAGDAALDAASTTGAISTVGFIAGPALLATGVVLLLAGGRDAEAGTGRGVRPVVAADAGGGFVGAAGRF